MSNKFEYPVYGLDLAERVIAGLFLPQGASAPKVPADAAGVYSVTRTGTGAFLITLLGDHYEGGGVATAPTSLPLLIGAEFGLQLASSTLRVAEGGAWTASAGTLVVRIKDPNAGTAQDVAANAGNIVHFVLTFQNLGSSIQSV